MRLITLDEKQRFNEIYLNGLTKAAKEYLPMIVHNVPFPGDDDNPVYAMEHDEYCDSNPFECLRWGFDSREWGFARVDGRLGVKVLAPKCRDCSNIIGGGMNNHLLAVAIGEDLNFRIAAVIGNKENDLRTIREEENSEPFDIADLCDSGIKSVVHTSMSSYWVESEIREFARLHPKKRKQAAALYHPRITNPWRDVLQDAYLFDFPVSLPDFPLGVFKQGISIRPRQRFHDIRRQLKTSYPEDKLQFAEVISKGGRTLENQFKSCFSSARLDPKLAASLGLINPTEWYDGRARQDALKFLQGSSTTND